MRILRPLGRRSGFSLVEILISIVVLSIGMMGLMAAMLFGLRGQDHALNVSDANGYARQIMETLRINNRVATYTNEASPVALNTAPFNGAWGVSLPGDTRFQRQVNCTMQSTATVGGNTIQYWQIRVRLFWTSTGSGTPRTLELVGYHKT